MTDLSALRRSLNPAPPRQQVEPIAKTAPKAKRRPGLAPRSAKRIAEAPLRAAFREAVLEKARYQCEGPARGLPDRCASPLASRPTLEVHEPDQRSTHPGSHVRSTLAVALCQHHHDLVTSPVGEMRVLVESLGLIVRATR